MEIKKLLEICVQKIIFKLITKFVVILMSSQLSPLLAGIVINYLENKIFNSNKHLIKQIVC